MLEIIGLVSFSFYTHVASSKESDSNFSYIPTPLLRPTNRGSITLGFCNFAYYRSCPDPDITYFYYSHQNPKVGEQIFAGLKEESNIERTTFNPNLPTKIIIHGYNSNMFLGVLDEIKSQYFQNNELNIILVDWSALAKGPCYPAAVWNSRIVGQCTAQMVQQVIKMGAQNIHIIGFSLGAHIAGFIANNVKPFRIARITGLDPAMPGFVTVDKQNKLDTSDAEFVDILHTNAFVQGIAQPIGHVDFYVNGGMVQPGCWAEARFFACNHHRAPLYFAESINTKSGFWGWYCSSYLEFLLGRCLPKDPQIIMGEYVNKADRGIYLVITNSVSPFAVGKYNGPLIEILKRLKKRS